MLGPSTNLPLQVAGALLVMAGMVTFFVLLKGWLSSRAFVPPRAPEAIAICWAAMDMTGKAPGVSWQPAGERCGPDGRGYVGAGGRCVAGESWYGQGSRVAWWPSAAFSATALAHELAHHARWRRHQGDMFEGETSAHTSATFAADVQRATAALKAWEEFA